MSSLFVWERYKTDECHGECQDPSVQDKENFFRSNDHHQFQCTRWHDKTDRRRPVVVKEKNKINYSRLYVKDTYIMDSKHCNNYIEYLYHPQNYKSRECPSISSGVSGAAAIPCVYGSMCPYYHSVQEKNDWLNDPRALKFRAAPKEKFTQSLLDDFNNIQSSYKQLEKLYESAFKGSSNVASSQNSQTQIPQMNGSQASTCDVANSALAITQESQISQSNQNLGFFWNLLPKQPVQGQQAQPQLQASAVESLQQQQLQTPTNQIAEEQQSQQSLPQIKEEMKKQPEDNNILEQITKSATPPAITSDSEQLSAAPVDLSGFQGIPKTLDHGETPTPGNDPSSANVSNPGLNNNATNSNNNNNLLDSITTSMQQLGNPSSLSIFEKIAEGIKTAAAQQQQLLSSSSASTTGLAQPVVQQVRNNKREKNTNSNNSNTTNNNNKNSNKEQKPKEKAAAQIDMTKQLSKITDLSLNDDYLKESFDKPKVRKYQYHQNIGLHECPTVEFKNYQKLSFCQVQKDMNASLRLQEYGPYICGFLNHRGGTMYIGIHDDGWVDGIYLNSKKRDWFCQHIDNVTQQIEPRLVVGEIRIQFIEVLNKPIISGLEGVAYVIELSIVKTNFSELYFYDKQAYVKRTASLTKMSIQEIKQDLLVKLKKQSKAEANTINKLIQFEDASDLENQSLEQLNALLKNLEGAVAAVKERISKIQLQKQPQVLL